MRPSLHAFFTDRFRRLCAAGGAALVLALTVFSASPVAHEWLHSDHDHDAPADHGCAVVLFAAGVALPLGLTAVPPPETVVRAQAGAPAREIFLISPRYLRQPERGPPAARVG